MMDHLEDERNLHEVEGTEEERDFIEPEATTTEHPLSTEGEVTISEEVILQLATQALKGISGVRPAGASPLASLGIGRKTTGGMRVSLDDAVPPAISVDAYILVKYGLRIPDVAWDVQESVKSHLEKFTGYRVKVVNVFVQGVYLNEPEKEEGVTSPLPTEEIPGAGDETL